MSSFVSFASREKYGLSGLVTRTSRPATVNVSALSFAAMSAAAAIERDQRRADRLRKLTQRRRDDRQPLALHRPQVRARRFAHEIEITRAKRVGRVLGI